MTGRKQEEKKAGGEGGRGRRGKDGRLVANLGVGLNDGDFVNWCHLCV